MRSIAMKQWAGDNASERGVYCVCVCKCLRPSLTKKSRTLGVYSSSEAMLNVTIPAAAASPIAR
jgi:hypothetical protein